MLNTNNKNSNHKFLAAQKSYSNTPLFLHLPITLSTNSFKSYSSTQVHSHLLLKLFSIHLDYLRISSNNLNSNSFHLLTTILFSKVDSKTINKPWHPHAKTPKKKKYQYRIVSQTGIVLGITKRAKYKGENTRYVYDIMLDITGAYFANLSLLEQIEVIQYLNNNWRVKCHRIDVAMDDYTRKLFSVNQMITAFLEDNNFGFKVIDDSYLDIVKNRLIGTLGIGSRRSSFFIRIYTRHKLFVRWETELKQDKAQKTFTEISNLAEEKLKGTLPVTSIIKVLKTAAIGKIDFRDKSDCNSPKNATRERTNRLPFWENVLNIIDLSTGNIANSKELKNRLTE